jgi:hypothetical protein
MPYRETSRQAYNTADLPQRQHDVYLALKNGPKTDPEIVAWAGIPLQSVCGARNALIERGMVLPTSLTRPNANGNPCIIWRLVFEDEFLARQDPRVEADQPQLGL